MAVGTRHADKFITMEQWALLLLLGLLAAALLIQWGGRSNSKRLPPGPRPLPVIGNLLLFAASKSWHRDFWKLAEQYGPIMWLRLGSQGAIMVQSPELAMEILKHQDSIFCSRPPPSYTVGLVTKNSKSVGFAPSGSHWRLMRKLFTMELLASKRIDDFQHVRVEELGRLVEAIRSHIGHPVDLGYLLMALNLNNVTRMGFSHAAIPTYQVEDLQNKEKANPGVVYSSSDHEDHELPHLLKEVVDMLGVQGIGDAIPWLAFLDKFLLPKAKFQQTVRLMDFFYTKVIQEHREYLEAHPGSQPRDFADLLLTVSSSDGQPLTDDNIISQFAVLLTAGTDTTSSSEEWAMAELLRQPTILEKVVQELEEVVGSRAVSESDIPNLPYLQAVVKETLRMHPPTPFLIPHYSTHATTLAGYHIPANTTVFVNIWGIGRDPASWPDPHKFQPERFIHQRPDLDVLGHHFELLPFGSGKRMCPGMGLGLVSLQFCLATLLHTFTWSLPADVAVPEDLDMSERQSITIHKAISLKAVPSKKL